MPENMPDVEYLTRDQALSILRDIQEALWPRGDEAHQWSPDTLNDVYIAMQSGGLAPYGYAGDDE